jgi:hypothetical protein
MQCISNEKQDIIIYDFIKCYFHTNNWICPQYNLILYTKQSLQQNHNIRDIHIINFGMFQNCSRPVLFMGTTLANINDVQDKILRRIYSENK